MQVFKIPTASTQAISSTQVNHLPASVAGNYLIMGNGNEMRILTKDTSSGLFYTRWFTSQSCYAVATNGVWFACASDTDLILFTFDESSSNYGTMLTYPEVYANVQFLSDGSLVTVNETTVVTRVNSSGTWNIVDTTSINVAREDPFGVVVHLTETTLAYALGNNAYLMQRNQNYSWTVLEQVPILFNDTKFPGQIFWANDTLLVTYVFHTSIVDWSSGVQLLVKTDNGWNVTLDTQGDGYVEMNGGLGTVLLPLSETQILVNALFDGTATRGFFGVGSILLLERGSDRQWRITSLVQNTVRDEMWGLSMLKTDRDVLIWNCRVITNGMFESMCGFVPVPLCFSEPISVTCLNQQLASCTSVSNFKTDELFTVKNACGMTEVASRASFSTRGLQVSLEFSRFGVQLAACNATVSCTN